MKKNKSKIEIGKELQAYRRLELSEIDSDILVAADKAEIGYDPERMERLQILRYLQRLVNLLEKRKIKWN